MLQWVCSNGALCFVYATSQHLKLIIKSLLRSCFSWAPGAPWFGKELGGAVVPLALSLGLQGMLYLVWFGPVACKGSWVFFFKLLSLSVRQAPSLNKFLAYLKVVDTPCVSELCASRAGCCGLGVSAAPVLWLCERQKQMFLCCFSALHKGEVCPALPGPL